MKKPPAIYTVWRDRKGYPVSYLDPTTSQVNMFSGSFGDPGKALQEFKASVGGEASCYLAPARFRTKVEALLRQQKADEQRLQAWNAAGAQQ